jgi:hypothetical protein
MTNIVTYFLIFCGFSLAQINVVKVENFQDYLDGCYTDNGPIRRIDYYFKGTSKKLDGNAGAYSFEDVEFIWFAGSAMASNDPKLTAHTFYGHSAIFREISIIYR